MLLFGSLPVVVMAKVADPSVADIVKRTDELDSANKLREAYEYISQYAHIDDVEIHNRVARECYYVSKYYAKDNNEAKSLANEGLKHAEMATKLDPNNYRAFRVCCVCLCLQVYECLIVDGHTAEQCVRV